VDDQPTPANEPELKSPAEMVEDLEPDEHAIDTVKGGADGGGSDDLPDTEGGVSTHKRF
jgi:hypothetical protein